MNEKLKSKEQSRATSKYHKTKTKIPTPISSPSFPLPPPRHVPPPRSSRLISQSPRRRRVPRGRGCSSRSGAVPIRAPVMDRPFRVGSLLSDVAGFGSRDRIWADHFAVGFLAGFRFLELRVSTESSLAIIFFSSDLFLAFFKCVFCIF